MCWKQSLQNACGFGGGTFGRQLGNEGTGIVDELSHPCASTFSLSSILVFWAHGALCGITVQEEEALTGCPLCGLSSLKTHEPKQTNRQTKSLFFLNYLAYDIQL